MGSSFILKESEREIERDRWILHIAYLGFCVAGKLPLDFIIT